MPIKGNKKSIEKMKNDAAHSFSTIHDSDNLDHPGDPREKVGGY
jgi:hypothetical protein